MKKKTPASLDDAIAEELAHTEPQKGEALDYFGEPPENELAGGGPGAGQYPSSTQVKRLSKEIRQAMEAGKPIAGMYKIQPLPTSLVAELHWIEGGAKQRLTKSLTIIGRVAEVADVVLTNDSQVSRHHAAITHADGAFFLEDLDSTNGTVVGGKRIKRVELKSGQVVKIGMTRLRLVVKPA